jgi:hypothetical protein
MELENFKFAHSRTSELGYVKNNGPNLEVKDRKIKMLSQ